MTEWTQTVQTDGAEFSVNAMGTHVTVSTIHGSYTQSLNDIEAKLRDHDLLPAVRSMFQAMLDYYKENKK